MGFAADGILIASAQEVKTTIGPRADKNNNTQIHVTMTMGAVRMEACKVIEILCNNT
jgi:hypothetical protein